MFLKGTVNCFTGRPQAQGADDIQYLRWPETVPYPIYVWPNYPPDLKGPRPTKHQLAPRGPMLPEWPNDVGQDLSPLLSAC